LEIPVPHVKIHEVVPVPPIYGQDTEDKEVADEDKRFRRCHEGAAEDGKTLNYIASPGNVKEMRAHIA
jgi:hypothetical protein